MSVPVPVVSSLDLETVACHIYTHVQLQVKCANAMYAEKGLVSQRHDCMDCQCHAFHCSSSSSKSTELRKLQQKPTFKPYFFRVHSVKYMHLYITQQQYTYIFFKTNKLIVARESSQNTNGYYIFTGTPCQIFSTSPFCWLCSFAYYVRLVKRNGGSRLHYHQFAL